MRSKSDGVGRDVIPLVHNLASATSAQSGVNSTTHRAPRQHSKSPPPDLLVQRTTTESGTEFSWGDQNVSELRESSNSGVFPAVKAPTPMKGAWSDQNWSPSLLNAALQNRPHPFEVNSLTTSPGAANAEQHTAHQQALLEAALNSHHHHQQHSPSGTTTTQDSPLNLSATQPSGSSGVAAAVASVAVGQHLKLPHNSAGPFGAPQPRVPMAFVPQGPHAAWATAGFTPMVAQMVPPPPAFEHAQHHHHHHLHFQQQQLHHHHHGYMPAGAMHYQHHMPAAHLPPSALPGSQPLPYVIVRQPVSYHVPPEQQGPPRVHRPYPHPERPPPRQIPPTPATRGGASGGNEAFSRLRNGGPGTAAGALKASGSEEQSDSGANAAAERRVQHTKSDALAFVWKGWKYPAGLNRKERRRVMFGDDVKPGDYPGAVFVGTDFPDGSVDENGQPVQSSSGEQ
jgi:hypothetical protein